MIGLPLITCFVTVVLIFSMVCVETQDFCESYQKNNISLVVFSQSEDIIMLIVGTHFWRLREADKELVFVRQDFKASNASEQWTENKYDLAHPVYHIGDVNYRGIALFKDKGSKEGDKRKEFRYFDYNFYEIYGNYFKHLNEGTDKVMKVSSSKMFVSTIFDKRLNVEMHTLESSFKIQYCSVLNCSPKSKNFKTNISIIRSYLNSKKELILFFSNGDEIKYCAVDQFIKEEFKTLINCGKPQSVVNIWIVLVIGVVAVVVVVIIAVLIICCLRYFLTEQTRGEPKTVSALPLSSVPTLDATTGLPKNMSSVSDDSFKKQDPTPEPQKSTTPPKVKPVPKTVVKKASPVKQQKPITPPKGKGKMKPKKSPQLKN